MTMTRNILALAFASAIGSATVAHAADKLTPAQLADARTKVETAVALANIAKADKDGDAMLVAAKMLASTGPVAEQGGKMKGGKPTLMDTGKMAKMAKDMGADAKKADEVAAMSTSSGEKARSDGYWYYSCDSYNNCQWIYAGW